MKKSEAFSFYLTPSIFFSFFFFSTFFFLYPNVDVGWHIQVAKFILEGKTLYKDIIEVNFPIIYYSKLAPVIFSEFLGYNVVWITEIYHVLLTLILLLISLDLIRKSDEEYRLKFLFGIATSYSYFIIPLEIYSSQLGQKEHYFIIFFLPYFLLNFLNFKDELSKKLKIFIGILAAIAVCTKPYFAIIIIFFEIGQFIFKKSIIKRIKDRDFIYCLVSCLILVTIFAVFFLNNYLNNIAPIIKYNYSEHSVFNRVSLYRYFDWTAIVLFPVLSIFIKRHRRLTIFLLSFLGAFLVLLMQNESIYSVKMPMYSIKAFLLLYMLHITLKEARGILKGKYIFILIICAAILLSFKPVYKNLSFNFASEIVFNKPKKQELYDYIKSLETNKVFVLTQKGLGANFPMVHLLNIDYIWNYSSFWVVPEKYYLNNKNVSDEEEKEINEFINKALKDASNAIITKRPEYVIIFNYNYVISKNLDEKSLVKGLVESNKEILEIYENIGDTQLEFHAFTTLKRKNPKK